VKNNHSLQQANHDKITKYEPLKDIIMERYNVGQVEVRGLAIGVLGSWCDQNTCTLGALGIQDQRFRVFLCNTALRGTINLRIFMDGWSK
jgi:hypothetical protein